ncbi:MAG: hypothetical protein WCJ37_01805 [Syntrophus sp. (in: bacteria)]
MKSEDPDRIPEGIKKEHLNRKTQGMNLHICMTLHKSKLAALIHSIDEVEQAGDPDAIQKLHREIEAEKVYADVLLYRQSMVSKQYGLACNAYNHALAQTAECWGCNHLRAERNDPVKFCCYDINKPKPVNEVKRCPDPKQE